MTSHAPAPGFAFRREQFQQMVEDTLARARGPAGGPPLERYLEEEGDYRGPGFEVSEITLYESRLGPGGPRYLPRKIISLL